VRQAADAVVIPGTRTFARTVGVMDSYYTNAFAACPKRPNVMWAVADVGRK
jgi:hypothetical protein